MKKVSFENSSFLYLVAELSREFEKLEEIVAVSTNLNVLEFDDFLPDNKIKFLNVSGNKISKIDSRVTLRLSNLETLDLSNNFFREFIPTVFNNLKKLKFLSVSHNRLSKLDDILLEYLLSVETLKFDHNKIEEIVGNFDKIDFKWKKLHLQHNQLKTFPPSLAKSLSYLDLSTNLLHEVNLENSSVIELFVKKNELEILTINKTLEKLDASENNKFRLDLSLNNNTVLKYLDLSDTKLKAKNDFLEKIKTLLKLEYLDLSHANIQLQENTFNGLKFLRTLKLANGISSKHIPKKVFLSLTALENLDISENFLNNFDLNELKNSKSLETLIMKESEINELNGCDKIKEILPSLKQIDVHGNKFKCNDLPEIIEGWKDQNITIVWLDEIGESDFVRESCLKEDKHEARIDKSSEWSYFWCFAGVLLLLAVGFGVVVMMKKHVDTRFFDDVMQIRYSVGRSLINDEDLWFVLNSILQNEGRETPGSHKKYSGSHKIFSNIHQNFHKPYSS